jgi:hypothetical protein
LVAVPGKVEAAPATPYHRPSQLLALLEVTVSEIGLTVEVVTVRFWNGVLWFTPKYSAASQLGSVVEMLAVRVMLKAPTGGLSRYHVSNCTEDVPFGAVVLVRFVKLLPPKASEDVAAKDVS